MDDCVGVPWEADTWDDRERQTCGKCEALAGGYCPPMTASWMDNKLGLMSWLLLNWTTYSWVVEEEERNFDPQKGPTWMKCLFVPPLDLCPRDIGVGVWNYFPLSRVLSGKVYGPYLLCKLPSPKTILIVGSNQELCHLISNCESCRF